MRSTSSGGVEKCPRRLRSRTGKLASYQFTGSISIISPVLPILIAFLLPTTLLSYPRSSLGRVKACRKKHLLVCHAERERRIRVGHAARLVAPDASLRSA